MDKFENSDSYFEIDGSVVICKSLGDVRDHFANSIDDLDKGDWEIFCFEGEFDEYPGCYVFTAVNNLTDETVDVPWAALPKSACNKSDRKAIEKMPPLTFSDEDFEKDDDVPVIGGNTID